MTPGRPLPLAALALVGLLLALPALAPAALAFSPPPPRGPPHPSAAAVSLASLRMAAGDGGPADDPPSPSSGPRSSPPGPRSGAARRGSGLGRRRSAAGSGSGSGSGPASAGPRQRRTGGRCAVPPPAPPRQRAPHQFDHTLEDARPFVDGRTEAAGQVPNEDAPPLSIPAAASSRDGDEILHEHVGSASLDGIFPGLGFSRRFASSGRFRTELRTALRADVFDTTPAYHSMSEKARRMLLLPDSSLQGSWRCGAGRWARKGGAGGGGEGGTRMTALTEVLRRHLGEGAPTGDEFLDGIGALCGSEPSTHWIDIVGVLDRRISHSWHMDTGRSRNGDTRTVLLAFPPEDDYDGVGVFSHIVKLERERHAADDHPPSEPVVFADLQVSEEHIVRPSFREGREIIYYRDIDVLHSSPDVAYRASVMRFM